MRIHHKNKVIPATENGWIWGRKLCEDWKERPLKMKHKAYLCTVFIYLHVHVFSFCFCFEVKGLMSYHKTLASRHDEIPVWQFSGVLDDLTSNFYKGWYFVLLILHTQEWNSSVVVWLSTCRRLIFNILFLLICFIFFLVFSYNQVW